MSVRDAAWCTASVGMATEARARIVRVTCSVRGGDRRAECLVRRDDACGAAWQVTQVAVRLGEVELGVLPFRVDQLRAVALVARREVAAARRIDPEHSMCRPRLAVLGYEPGRATIVLVAQQASGGSAGCDGTCAEPEVAGGRRYLSAVGDHLVRRHAGARRAIAALDVAIGAVHVRAASGVDVASGAGGDVGRATGRHGALVREGVPS